MSSGPGLSYEDGIREGQQEERDRVRHILARKRHKYEDTLKLHKNRKPSLGRVENIRECELVLAVLESLDLRIAGGGA